ncbi:XRE family transcriptional regulator [Pseudomonas sp. DY-1]|uniref:helix-turn-helix domain-containing protein n=1 Tax=Pseudomonas sp. DY-1 TaxID=1755504 RepID=UPI000EAAA33B|nr:helix-turn-helix transcriptional regulator [Pseudomonas sp. DY-1]AYF85643.1 XRE family transcriptional regulator [Pseudomonas sp. DY-1]AYF85660.1 XRE family transcriptional regulator [Pseudomonas sp. DY-1]AYF85680.1 XRE family transcriptional regulator [Pseudomonas sp. DY-1]AYF85696.1 XRE family transcriptional regulator [Pseudomonas sp. DY-1]AYF90727.1 XRE family transcriptional regulator [Pseudomonas sp. DY-1]
MIKARVIEILKSSGIRLPELEERTGISRYTWNNLKNPARKREIKEEEILAIAKVFPQYRWWMLTGEVAPEMGQTSPDYDAAHSNLPNQSAG